MIYLPENAKAVLVPYCDLAHGEEDEILHYKSEIKIKQISKDKISKLIQNLLNVFIKLFRNVIDKQYQYLTQQTLIPMFNFIVTIFNNLNPAPMNVHSAAVELIQILQENDHLIQDNVYNLVTYFSDFGALKEYQSGIAESSEEDLQEMMYYDANFDAGNTGMIGIEVTHQELTEEEFVKIKMNNLRYIFNFEKIKNSIGQKALNLRLKLIEKKKSHFELSPPIYNFLLQTPNDFRMTQFYPLCKSLKEIFDQIQKMSHVLFNILSSHVYIQNSLDTHYITQHLNKLNQLVLSSHQKYRTYLLQRENSNPFVEIDQEQEVGYLDEQDQFKFETLVNEIKEHVNNLESELKVWLTKKEDLQILNLQTKQKILTHKLKWEQLFAKT